MKKRKTLSKTQAKKELRVTTKSSDQCLMIITACLTSVITNTHGLKSKHRYPQTKLPQYAHHLILLILNYNFTVCLEMTTSKKQNKQNNNCDLHMSTSISKF